MKAWTALAALLIALVTGVNLFELARRFPLPPRAGVAESGDVVMRHERRFAGVRAALQAHGARGLVGYATDVPPDELTRNDAAMQEYFVSQFALAPWVLEAKFSGCAWAVGNFRTKPPADRVPEGFRLARDFGDGVLLLQKAAP